MIRAAIVLSALALAGCAASPFGGDRVIKQDIRPNYSPSLTSAWAGAGGGTSIYGTTRDGASEAEIASAIRLPAHFSQRSVRANDPSEKGEGPQLVLVFAPQSGLTPTRACAGESRGGQAGPQLRVYAVYCNGAFQPVSEAELVAEGSPTPGDPAFTRAMSVLLNNLIPVWNPDFQGDRPSIRRRR